jgi:hypothetical protein
MVPLTKYRPAFPSLSACLIMRRSFYRSCEVVAPKLNLAWRSVIYPDIGRHKKQTTLIHVEGIGHLADAQHDHQARSFL